MSEISIYNFVVINRPMLLLKARKAGLPTTPSPTFYLINAIFQRKGTPSVYLL